MDPVSKIHLELYINHLAVPPSQTELRDEVVNLEGLYKCCVYIDMYMMCMEDHMVSDVYGDRICVWRAHVHVHDVYGGPHCMMCMEDHMYMMCMEDHMYMMCMEDHMYMMYGGPQVHDVLEGHIA